MEALRKLSDENYPNEYVNAYYTKDQSAFWQMKEILHGTIYSCIETMPAIKHKRSQEHMCVYMNNQDHIIYISLEVFW